MAGIKDAIVETLNANAPVAQWATGGVFARRAPQLPTGSATRRRDKYIVVRVTNSDPDESHTQDGPATLVQDRIEVSIWASSSKDADIGATVVRHALDAMQGDSAGVTIRRMFWRGTVDREVEDASSAEQLMDCCLAEFDVSYVLEAAP